LKQYEHVPLTKRKPRQTPCQTEPNVGLEKARAYMASALYQLDEGAP